MSSPLNLRTSSEDLSYTNLPINRSKKTTSFISIDSEGGTEPSTPSDISRKVFVQMSIQSLQNDPSLVRDWIGKIKEEIPSLEESLKEIEQELSSENHEQKVDSLISLLQNSAASRRLTSPAGRAFKSTFNK